MLDRPGLTPRRRDATLLLLGVLLLASPFLIGQFHFDDSIREYERIEVTAEEGTVEYGPAYTGNLVRIPISDHIGCTFNHYRSDQRYCSLEASIASDDRRVLTGWATGPGSVPETSEFRYLALNGSIYEPTLTVNETPDPDRDPNRTEAVYPIYLDLEPVPADRALRTVSVPVTAGRVPDIARRRRRPAGLLPGKTSTFRRTRSVSRTGRTTEST